MTREFNTTRLIKNFSLLILLIFTPTLALGQTTTTTPAPTPQKYTRPTSITRPLPAPLPTETLPAGTTTVPDIEQPPTEPVFRTQGLLVETLDGKVLMEQGAEQAFNPASGVKLGTALAALKNFGAEHRFSTGVWTNGTFNASTGTITGDLIVSGRDPSFHYEHAVMIARELNKQGIRVVTGDLIVAPGFTMNFDWSAQRSGNQFYDTLDATRRPAAASRAWMEERSIVGDMQSLQSVPSVAVMGAVYVDSVPAGARTLLIHRSSKLIDVLKVLLCYSNNFMAERIGDTMGGPRGLERFITQELNLYPGEIKLASASGLGVNRITPRVMMKIYRALRGELARNRLSPSDILPVAGIDPGTLEKRYTDFQSRGSVIAKTGTLIRTDGGASALVGQMNTRNGQTLLFVIFNQRGNVWRFRENQDQLVAQIQNSHGGPAPFKYRATTLAVRLAATELKAIPARPDEYEPGQN